MSAELSVSVVYLVVSVDSDGRLFPRAAFLDKEHAERYADPLHESVEELALWDRVPEPVDWVTREAAVYPDGRVHELNVRTTQRPPTHRPDCSIVHFDDPARPDLVHIIYRHCGAHLTVEGLDIEKVETTYADLLERIRAEQDGRCRGCDSAHYYAEWPSARRV